MRAEEIRSESEEERISREEREADAFEMSRPLNERIAEKNWVSKEVAGTYDPGSPGFAKRPSGSRRPGLRMTAKKIILSGPFEQFTSLVIVGNTITMGMSSEEMADELKEALLTFEMIFLICYILEAALKWLACGWKVYSESKANRFDIFVILASVLGFVATFFEDEVKVLLGGSAEDQMGSMQSLRAVRLLRALQVVRLLNRQKALLMILRTIFQAWKPIMIHSFFCVFSMSMYLLQTIHKLSKSFTFSLSLVHL